MTNIYPATHNAETACGQAKYAERNRILDLLDDAKVDCCEGEGCPGYICDRCQSLNHLALLINGIVTPEHHDIDRHDVDHDTYGNRGPQYDDE